MTTTSTYSGKFDNKNSSRVLRPPGGGSSDIFGAPTPQVVSKPSKRHDSNNIFGDAPATPDTPTKVNERITKSNVFGAAEAPQQPSANKSRQPDSDIFGPPDAPRPSSKKAQAVINPITGEVVVPAHKTDVAPAKPDVNKENEGDSPITSGKSTDQSYHPSTRVRQPPGGASTKLW
eukprot:GHVU01104579.1.p1 GENE.GHVU01104579.1~~GHVU01104579.1.p1  ORF type:complete len:188 (-),score=19.79 GHVU01104579.1:2042-2569(-)